MKNNYLNRKKIVFNDVQSVNDYFKDFFVEEIDLLEIRYTNNYLHIKKISSEDFEIKESLKMSKLIELSIFFIFTLGFLLSYYLLITEFALLSLIAIFFSTVAFIITTLQDHRMKELQLVTKDGRVYEFLIPKDKYDTVKKSVQSIFLY